MTARLIEKIYHNKSQIFDKYLEKISSLSNYKFFFGSELEFYLTSQNKDKNRISLSLQTFINSFLSSIKDQNSLIYHLEKEQGFNQLELKFSPTYQAKKLSDEINLAKKQLIKMAENFDFIADFSSVFDPQDCSSSVQISISILELSQLENKNILNDDEILLKNLTLKILENCFAGLVFLSPKIQDYQRFDLGYNLSLFKNGKYTAPVNFSFGFNNRSCGVRIVKKDNNFERLEIRFAAADCDIDMFLIIVMDAIISIFENDFEIRNFANLSPIFSNAFESEIIQKYQLMPIFDNYFEAEEFFLKSSLLNRLERFI
jgi:glutamine synthetase